MKISGYDEAEAIRERLRRLVSGHGGPTAVSNAADVPLPSLKRYLSGATRKIPLEVLAKVARGCGVDIELLLAPDDEWAIQGGPSGRAETEVEPDAGPADDLPADHTRWIVRTRALELAGILPGDVIEFSTAGVPAQGEPVLAQIYGDERGSFATVMRLYMPPVLMVRTLDPAIEQLPVALDDRVRIVGIFIALRRLKRKWSR